MKKIRWNCPECGKGKNLGARPRRNATDRFCIPCSVKTGTMVERFAPSKIRQREAACAKSKKKAAKKKVAAEKKWIVETDIGPINAQDKFKEYWKVACKIHPPLASSFRFNDPFLTLNKSRDSFYTSGRANYSAGRVHITAGSSGSDLLYVIAHEIVHHMRYANGGLRKNGRFQHHDDQFHSLQRLLVDELGIKTREDR